MTKGYLYSPMMDPILQIHQWVDSVTGSRPEEGGDYNGHLVRLRDSILEVDGIRYDLKDCKQAEAGYEALLEL